MIRLVFITFMILASVLVHAEVALPSNIEEVFRKAHQPSPTNPTIPYREEQFFVDYLTSNWRSIAENIECLPPRDGMAFQKEVLFNISVINFGYACCNLPPTEYVEFFEQIVSLCEQQRISLTAFENLYSGGYGKEFFWSVNWEHPKVQGIFDRIRQFDPPLDASFMKMMEKQARGKLADNYMLNAGADTPLPQTLPGIKLQRPFASVIRKYEAMTGKKVPPDPDFPDHNITRPGRRSLQDIEVGKPAASIQPARPGRWLEILIACVAGLFLARLLWRRWKRTKSDCP